MHRFNFLELEGMWEKERMVMRITQASDNPKGKKLKYFMKHCFKDNAFMPKCLLMSR